jgi:anti-sigma factor RsiW
MGKVIRLHGDSHQEFQLLLPWYATGRLDAEDQSLMQAHLEGCPECQAELRAERRLAELVADLPVGPERAWASMLERLEGAPKGRRPAAYLRRWTARQWRAGALLLGSIVAAQAAMFLVVAALWQRPEPGGVFHTLSSPPPPAAGNIVVVFQPQTTEQALREILKASDARLVDGPTPAGAYVLRAPNAERPDALTRLRSRPEVVLAEPIDPREAP